MTEVIFSFDTEDYTNPGSDEAILRLAGALQAESIRASFNFVAALAEALVERDRYDILEALRFHEINYHSYRHSWHPVPFLLAGANVCPDEVKAFGERACMQGGYSLIPSYDLLPLAMAVAGKLGKYGA